MFYTYLLVILFTGDRPWQGVPSLAGGAVLSRGAILSGGFWEGGFHAGLLWRGCHEKGVPWRNPSPTTVSSRAVRILLECILVWRKYYWWITSIQYNLRNDFALNFNQILTTFAAWRKALQRGFNIPCQRHCFIFLLSNKTETVSPCFWTFDQ